MDINFSKNNLHMEKIIIYPDYNLNVGVCNFFKIEKTQTLLLAAIPHVK